METNRMAAARAREKRYMGAVCPRHPDAGGVRHTSSGSCVHCTIERAAARTRIMRDLLAGRSPVSTETEE